MEDKEYQINQSIEGSGNAQAAGDRSTAISLFGIPLEQLIMIEVVTSIILLCIGNTLSLIMTPSIFCTFWLFPLIFGLPAIHSLVTGISLKNKNIIILSVISGALSLLGLVILMFITVTGLYLKALGIEIQ